LKEKQPSESTMDPDGNTKELGNSMSDLMIEGIEAQRLQLTSTNRFVDPPTMHAAPLEPPVLKRVDNYFRKHKIEMARPHQNSCTQPHGNEKVDDDKSLCVIGEPNRIPSTVTVDLEQPQPESTIVIPELQMMPTPKTATIIAATTKPKRKSKREKKSPPADASTKQDNSLDDEYTFHFGVTVIDDKSRHYRKNLTMKFLAFTAVLLILVSVLVVTLVHFEKSEKDENFDTEVFPGSEDFYEWSTPTNQNEFIVGQNETDSYPVPTPTKAASSP